MSHVSTVSVTVKDLAALKAAVHKMGGIFVQNQKTYTWWGVSVGDSPMPAGLTQEMLGKCEHAIKLPGVNYEVGVVKLANGTYTLAYDEYNCGRGPNGIKADGGKLIERFGQGLKKLTQNYAVCVATMAARAKGWLVAEQKLGNGSVKLTVTGMR